jgi:hypothetical protein
VKIQSDNPLLITQFKKDFDFLSNYKNTVSDIKTRSFIFESESTKPKEIQQINKSSFVASTLYNNEHEDLSTILKGTTLEGRNSIKTIDIKQDEEIVEEINFKNKAIIDENWEKSPLEE